MKNRILTFCFLLLGGLSIHAQEDIRFTVAVSTDSVLLGNPFQVQFTIENTSVRNFSAPIFDPKLSVVSGPNQSTSLTMINGQTQQKVTYSYVLDPVEVGIYYIDPATVDTDLGFLETNPIQILVVENPEGIQQSRQMPLGNQQLGFDHPDPGFGNDFFQPFNFNDFEELMKPFGPYFEFGEGRPLQMDSLMQMMAPGFNFEWKIDSLLMPFGGGFYHNSERDSLQMIPFNDFYNALDIEKLKKLFPHLPEEYWQQLDPALQEKKKKRRTFKM